MSIYTLIPCFSYQGKAVGFCRLTEDLVLINNEDVPDSTSILIEDHAGFRYRRSITLTLKAQELPGVTGYIFKKI